MPILPLPTPTPDEPWWPVNAPVEGPSLLYVGSAHFALRGWLPVASKPYVEKDLWWIRLSVEEQATGIAACMAPCTIVARMSNVRMVLVNNEAQQPTCSLCHRLADARGCTMCGLELGALYDPTLPNRVLIYGVPNLARLSGRQAAQEFFSYRPLRPARRHVSV